MPMYIEEDWNRKHTAITLAACVGLLVSGMAAYPPYRVWSARKEGEAELAQADYNRKIKTVEAEQTKEAAVLLADAEVTRAKGVAKANQIIGDSLKGNEGYLHYLWISNLEKSTQPSVIYVPTEANFPLLLEAGKRGSGGAQGTDGHQSTK